MDARKSQADKQGLRLCWEFPAIPAGTKRGKTVRGFP
jgi:hypothetical protein